MIFRKVDCATKQFYKSLFRAWQLTATTVNNVVFPAKWGVNMTYVVYFVFGLKIMYPVV